MPIDLGPIVLRSTDTGQRFTVDTRAEANKLIASGKYVCIAGMGQNPANDPDTLAKLMDLLTPNE